MKFAKTLEDLMVPEWRTQYVQYKLGKKRIKATTAKLRVASSSPAVSALRKSVQTAAAHTPRRDTVNELVVKENGETETTRRSRADSILRRVVPGSGSTHPATAAVSTENVELERSPLHTAEPVGYGSMERDSGTGRPPSLVLPAPMQHLPKDEPLPDATQMLRRMSTAPADLEEVLPKVQPVRTAGPSEDWERPFLHRVLTLRRNAAAQPVITAQNVTEVQEKAEKEFLTWLLAELKKCNEFYEHREREAVSRFEEMHEQLDIMRDRWFRAKHNLPFEEDDVEDVADAIDAGTLPDHSKHGNNSRRRVPWRTVSEAMSTFTHLQPTIAEFDTNVGTQGLQDRRDYERHIYRKPVNNPAHRVAKHKLKKAYIEYYHGLEMLKSYVTVNRECFRKITKKFDKSSGLRTSHRFMTEYVDKSYFGGPNKLDDLLNDTEVLFAKFFERGNRKEASSRLRSRENKTFYYDSVWRSGFFIGAAVIIASYATYEGVLKIYGEDRELALKTSYLLQLWGGVVLALLQVLLFAVTMKIWAKNKINYSFIFEFDPRHQLNYRQFLEIPAAFSLLFAVTYWFSTYDFWGKQHGPDMIHFPIIFVVVAAVTLFMPFKVFYYPSRRWFNRVLFRLAFSGAFPVEFKDFWMGDMFCSQTYALGNIELFFCLYANEWQNPGQCNSSNSRLMGFFTALPGIWRLLQCLRRYHNSKMWFPHLANGGKYAFTVLHYMTLSIWRIDTSFASAKAAFIFCASVNSVYTTVWDIVMDWSLLDPSSKHPFLRHNLGYKVTWPYYLAMFIDPILRCTWVFYIIFAGRIQHSALLSFLLSLAEVLRRFMWCFFRMENEHVGNVGAHRAYRHLPLPYHFPKTQRDTEAESLTPTSTRPVSSSTAAENVDVENHPELRLRRPSANPASPMVRTFTRVGRSMTMAHLHDYERRRPREDEEEEVVASSSDEEECPEDEEFYHNTADAENSERPTGPLRERRSTHQRNASQFSTATHDQHDRHHQQENSGSRTGGREEM